MSTDSHPPAITNDAYDTLLTDLRAIITAGRGRATATVNAELGMTYWKIGERIVREEQGGAARAVYATRHPDTVRPRPHRGASWMGLVHAARKGGRSTMEVNTVRGGALPPYDDLMDTLACQGPQLDPAIWDDLVDRLAVYDVTHLGGGSADYGRRPTAGRPTSICPCSSWIWRKRRRRACAMR